MANILVSTLPLYGHVNPVLPVAAELVARGHRVRWHTGREHAESVAAVGAQLIPPIHTPAPVQPPARVTGRATGVVPRAPHALAAAVRRAFVDPALGQLADFRAILAEFPADLLVTDTMGFGAMLLHELGGPPWATVGVTVPLLYRSDAPPLKSGIEYSTSAQARERYRAYWESLAGPLAVVTRVFNAKRAQVGLPALADGGGVARLAVSPFLHLQSGTAAFDYPYDEMPAQMHFVGPLLPSPGRFTPPVWWPELSTGRPVIHVTQGTIIRQPTDLIEPTVEGLASDEVTVVVTAAEPSAIGPVPANVRVARYISHAKLLPYVDVMISNGGYNGVVAALAHGVPLVVAGEHADKADVCARVAWVGAGINLGTGHPSATQVAHAVRKLLREPQYRQSATRIRDDFSRHDPAGEAADLLEGLIATGKPVVSPELQIGG